ncbi:transcriptional regulator [Methanofervidicoccus sp. A16]|uniref:GbsR/MarR family transcriptional regulator n=1 Tax=Methanofervidicoccus sp. A16 TaxID=2607662 RepID=UPI0011882C8B|nr:ArsR family transcriptional regulator [Methanofervidicoccus sp. A16]AXI24968.1 transcriptional regulator [Methanofervidicoccus sp. A16]
MEEIKETIIELFSDIAEIHGHSRSLGKIYAILYLADKPLCIEDIVKELGMSKGNVSMNLNKLEEIGLVKKIWIKGDRRNYYRCVGGFSSYKDIVKRKYETISRACDKLEKLKKKYNIGENDSISKKLKRIERMREVSRRVLEVLEEIDKDLGEEI